MHDEAPARLLQPQRAAGTLDQIRQRLDHRLPEVHRISGRRQCLREPQPFGAIVIAVREEVLVDQHAQACALCAREHEHDQQQQAGEQQRQLQHATPVAADEAHVIARGGDDQQIQTRQRERGRVEGHLARHRDPHRPRRTPRGGQRDQRDQQGQHEAPHRPDVRVDAAEQEGIGQQIQIENVTGRQREAQRLQAPARLHRQSAIQLFDQHQAEHGSSQKGAQHQTHRIQAVVGQHARGRQQQRLDDDDEARDQPGPALAGADQRTQQHQQEYIPCRAAQYLACTEQCQQRKRHRVRKERGQKPDHTPQRTGRDRGQQHAACQSAAPGKKQIQQKDQVGGSGKSATPYGDFVQLDSHQTT